MHTFRLNISEICMYSFARTRVQLTACRVVTESKANCILDLVSNLIITEKVHDMIGTVHFKRGYYRNISYRYQ